MKGKCCTCKYWAATSMKDYHPVPMKYDYSACQLLSTNQDKFDFQLDIRVCGPSCSADAHVFTKGIFGCTNYLEV